MQRAWITLTAVLIICAFAAYGCSESKSASDDEPQGISARQAYELALHEARDWNSAAGLVYLAVWDPQPDGRDAGPWTLEFIAPGTQRVLRVLVATEGVLRADESDISMTAYRRRLPDEWIDSTGLAELLASLGANDRPGWIAAYLNADPAWPGQEPQPLWRAAMGDGAAGTWYLADLDGNPQGTRVVQGY